MNRTASAAPPDTLAVAERLRPVLVRLARELRREATAVGLTAGQVTLLATIRDVPGVGVSDLAQREQVSAPSMCAQVDRLEAAGLVTRTRAAGDAPDRRRVDLTVTAEGRRRLQAARRRRTAWLAQRLDTLDPAQLAALLGGMDALEHLVGAPR